METIARQNTIVLEEDRRLVAAIMAVIDDGFLEKPYQTLVLEVRRVLSDYDENGVRHEDDLFPNTQYGAPKETT